MSAKVRWMTAIVGMLTFPLALHFVGWWLIAGDPSFSIDPRLDRYAVDSAREIADRQASDRLGWKLEFDRDGQRGGCVAKLTGPDGQRILGAELELEVFHAARSAYPERITSRPTADGDYAVDFAPTHSGFHVIRCRARRGVDRFSTEVRRYFEAPEPIRDRK